MRHAQLAPLLTLVVALMAGCASHNERSQPTSGEDERAIRAWFDQWLEASATGQLDVARSLIDDDAVFLLPSAGRMGKESYAAAATATDPNTDFELDCAIEEIKILGDHAWLVARLGLTMTDKRSGTITQMDGHSLSVLQRQGDRWVVVRDANTMVPAH